MGLLDPMQLDHRKPDGDPVITLDRVCDLNEALIVTAENNRRAIAAASQKS